MITVIQRVLESSVEVEGKVINKITDGLLVFLGVKKDDKEIQADYLAKKIANLRIFSDDAGKMNLNVGEKNGGILVISQFTLCTDNNKSGNRPSFTLAEEPEKAIKMYEYFVDKLKKEYKEDKVFTGIFSAHMIINIINDGPVTIILEK